MGGQVEWPEWWEWELELSVHLLRRMIRRHFSETDLRTMLSEAKDYKKDIQSGRWVVSTRWYRKPWEVIVEPDFRLGRLVVITAYMVE